jgi:hypothetical protein
MSARSQLLETTTTILDWRPITAVGDLIGFCSAQFPSGVIFHDCGVFLKNGHAWASPPGKPQVGRDGTVLRDKDGKKLYSKIIEFSSNAIRNRWSDTVIAALRRDFPDALPPAPDHAAAVEADLQRRPWK